MKVLVTGGAGHIGKSLVDRLVKDHEVVVVDDLSLGVRENVNKKAKFLRSDLTDIEKWYPEEIDLIYHLGMPSSNPMYHRDPYLSGKTINEFISIMELAKKNEVPVIYASTSSVYSGAVGPQAEDDKINPNDFYTAVRYAIEGLAKTYNILHGVKSTGLRFFAIYGRNEKHKGKYANLVSQFLWALQKDESPLVYGDGNQTRDFTYVEDVVDACLLAKNPVGAEIYNVGTGVSYTINKLIEILNEILGKDISPKYIKNPVKNYVFHTLADTTKAEAELGFKPKYSLRSGVEELM